MKLTEITVMRPSERSYSDMVDSFVAKHGLDTDGGGHADVFMTKDKPYVWRAWTKDPGYESFLRYIEKHKEDPHLPKVLSKVREEPIKARGTPSGVTLKFVKLEKLTPLPEGKLRNLLRELQGRNREFVEQRVPATWVDTIEQHKSFFDSVKKLIISGADDIDHANVMMRGDVPVIIDPAHRALTL